MYFNCCTVSVDTPLKFGLSRPVFAGLHLVRSGNETLLGGRRCFAQDVRLPGRVVKPAKLRRIVLTSRAWTCV